MAFFKEKITEAKSIPALQASQNCGIKQCPSVRLVGETLKRYNKYHEVKTIII